MATTMAQVEETSPVTQSGVAPWLLWTAVGLVVVLLLAALVWGIVVWRRKRAAAAPPSARGPTLAASLPALWRSFYRHIPEHARHYPTLVVLGAAGVGKSHAIKCHVDWLGQANQFRPSVDHDAAIQLYLGPDVVVHELSAPLLHDLSRGAKRALRRLWRRMGPSATVVLVLDARTLLPTPPDAASELAQLVRGKIGLFPRGVRAALDVRIYLSHLDLVAGYEEFAAAVGPDHEGLDLSRLVADPGAAERLVAGFDGQLAYALTTRSGEEFDRMVSFYAALRELLVGLRPLLVTLEGRDEPYAQALPVRRLYLGSLAPRSHIGECFAVDRGLVTRSLADRHRRGLRSAAIAAVGALVLLGSLAGWHVQRIRAAEARLDAFEGFVVQAPSSPGGAAVAPEVCLSDCALTQISADEAAALRDLATAIRDMKRSNLIWLSQLYVDRKLAVEARFAAALRQEYLSPQLRCSRPLRALYVVALLYASRDNQLGGLIREHQTSWAKELRLPAWIIDEYIAASDSDNADIAVNAPCIKKTGREWLDYLQRLDGKLAMDAITLDEAEALRELPPLRGPEEYAFLKQARQILANDNYLVGSLRQDLIEASFDWWTAEQHATLVGIREMIRAHLLLKPESTQGWGLHDLVIELSRPPVQIPEHFEITIDDHPIVLDGSDLAALIMRSRARLVINGVLDAIPAARVEDGRAFFGESTLLPAVGAVNGYGGGPTEVIEGPYTRSAFETHVAPVHSFANLSLLPLTVPEDPAAPATSRSAVRLAARDGRRLEQTIRAASGAYAAEYRRELVEYYQSFALEPATEMTLPFVFRHFWQSSSWFTEFLHATATNAAPTLPEGDPYAAPLGQALESFGPLVELLKSDSPVIPGLAPYQALLAGLQPKLSGAAGQTGAPELHGRLSALGALMLDAYQGKAIDPTEQVRKWLISADIDREWHDPFLEPLKIVRELGTENIIGEVLRAWSHEVYPVVRPLLTKYPFLPMAVTDAEPEEIEAAVRTQGKLRGEFWLAFDRLIAPVTTRNDGELAMLKGLESLSDLLYLPRDLERMARVLWDNDGVRVPLKVVLRPAPLPSEPEDGHAAAMAYLRSGGGAVYAFNQRPERQTLDLQWWNQGMSVLVLQMRPLVGGEPVSYTIEADGAFSFYHLLDRGAASKGMQERGSLTATAIYRATRCPPEVSGGTKGLNMLWRVRLGDKRSATRDVRMLLESDPWAAFAVRNCD